MSVFSDLLSAYINEKQIKILSLAKYCESVIHLLRKP